jgi:hypothetical protein
MKLEIVGDADRQQRFTPEAKLRVTPHQLQDFLEFSVMVHDGSVFG